MKFGVFAMPEHPPIENWTFSYDRDIASMVEAERLGFEEYWIGEHHTAGYENVPVPEFMIAKASAVTSRIKLGTGVVNLPYQEPFQVAERLAFLDRLTHGRLLFGFGGGGLPTDQTLFELDRSEAAPRTTEALEIISQLLNSPDPVTYKGQFWDYHGRQLQVGPYQENPQFAFAGLTGTHNYRRAGEKGWAALSIYVTPADNGDYPHAPDLLGHGKALDEGAIAAGRSAEEARKSWRVTREVYVSDNKNQAMAEIREGVKRSYDYLMNVGMGALMKKDVEMPDSDLTMEWMMEETPWIIGSPEDCIRSIHELRDQVGDFGTLLINGRDWVTTDRWNRSLELFARYVMPPFQRWENLARRERLVNVAYGR
ncbi:MAG: monooxygenase [Subtercola sp.]|nr:monooxygenase [Subtercola sp.]